MKSAPFIIRADFHKRFDEQNLIQQQPGLR